MDTPHTIHLTIPAESEGRSLLDIAPDARGDPAAAERLLARGGLWVDGARSQGLEARARAGAELTIQLPLSGVYPDITVTADQILYEDDDLLALNKPAGVYVDSTP